MNDLDGESIAKASLTLITGNGASLHPGEAAKTNTPLSPKLLVVLSPDRLAAAITAAHRVKMDPSDFALKSAKLILDILPPLYYEYD